MKKKPMCESCLMPLDKDPGVSGSDKYCSYCFKDGKLCYEGNDLKEFQKRCYEGMRANGVGEIKARFFTWLVRFAPRWRK
ncbi:MAG TPA: zinc ribbon domain-containing protein [Candidatus Paceibacterota bacterium]|nr:zinc ribbon domain-containing protein [Candidatus Paceibacterota bacterium]